MQRGREAAGLHGSEAAMQPARHPASWLHNLVGWAVHSLALFIESPDNACLSLGPALNAMRCMRSRSLT